MISTKNPWEVLSITTKVDERGSLTFLQEGGCPFTMKRIFVVYNVPKGTRRGGHAHIDSWQMHFCINGFARVWLDDGKEKKEFLLNSPSMGLLVAPLVWSEFELSSPNTSLIVASSNLYSEKDYIRNHEEFLEAIRESVR